MNEAEKNFFRPLWRRVAITVFCVAWSVFEWLAAEPFWAILASGSVFYCLWHYFYRFEDKS